MALGGCGETRTCTKKLTASLSGCLSCEKAQIKISKLNRLISRLEQFVDTLNPDCVEYRTELEELSRLKAFKKAVEGE